MNTLTENSEVLAVSNREPVWIRVGTLIDGSSSAPVSNANVVFNDEKILFVGKDSDLPPGDVLKPGQHSPDANYFDSTLCPGLIEAHAHLFLEGGELDAEKRKTSQEQSPEELLAKARLRLEPLVRLGLAGVRDAGDKDGVGLALSAQYKSGKDILMPYFESPGAGFHHEGRYGKFMGQTVEENVTPEACVAQRVKEGADRIKLIPTGIINFKKGLVTTAPQMAEEEIASFVRAAKAHSYQTFSHASGADGIENAIRAGVDSIEHGFFVKDEQLAYMRDNDIAWVPTFAPVQKQVDLADLMGWDDTIVGNLQRILDNHAASLCKGVELGVKIIAGSDAGSYAVAHGIGFLYELELMEKAGMSCLDIIRSATGVSSARLGYKERIGFIQAGYKPRMILSSNNPLETIKNLRKDKWVIFDGQVFFGNSDSVDTSKL